MVVCNRASKTWGRRKSSVRALMLIAVVSRSCDVVGTDRRSTCWWMRNGMFSTLTTCTTSKYWPQTRAGDHRRDLHTKTMFSNCSSSFLFSTALGSYCLGSDESRVWASSGGDNTLFCGSAVDEKYVLGECRNPLVEGDDWRESWVSLGRRERPLGMSRRCE